MNHTGLIMKKTGSKIIVNIIAFAISMTIIFPLVWVVYSSVKDNGEFMVNTLSFPSELVFDNYPKAFAIGNLWNAMFNSSIYTAINVVLVVVFALLSAYFFARYEFKGKSFFRMTYTIGMLIPLYALLVPIFVQYRMLDLINNRIPLIITYYGMSISLAIFLTESFIRGIPLDIDEASILDGCNIRQRLSRVIFPLCKPIIATISILTMLQTWNEFAFAVIITPREELRTVSIALRYYTTGLELEYTFLMAALVSTSLPIIITYLIFSKYVIKGMTAGAVKG